MPLAVKINVALKEQNCQKIGSKRIKGTCLWLEKFVYHLFPHPKLIQQYINVILSLKQDNQFQTYCTGNIATRSIWIKRK